MKNITFGFVAAVALGLASFAVPASAATSQPVGISAPAAATTTDFSAQRRVVRRTTVVRRGPVCTVRVVRSRGPMGRVVVRKTRVCR